MRAFFLFFCCCCFSWFLSVSEMEVNIMSSVFTAIETSIFLESHDQWPHILWMLLRSPLKTLILCQLSLTIQRSIHSEIEEGSKNRTLSKQMLIVVRKAVEAKSFCLRCDDILLIESGVPKCEKHSKNVQFTVRYLYASCFALALPTQMIELWVNSNKSACYHLAMSLLLL